ncbi:MAG TPA: class I SAM-dependent methyltransferase [Stellaceae bacterium]|nr:class I SAM-dependent methyltransferase [Stellaceae bacterium]
MSADARWVEDLPALAAEAYALAGRFCGACRDYHALWPYRRITLMHCETTTDQGAVGAALAELMARGGQRVLIAGAADSGVLATVARAAGGQAGEIRVVDRCETPLELCRRFARRWSLPLETARADLLRLEITNPVDIVYANSIIPAFPPARRLDLFARIARALQPGGHFVQTFNVSRRVAQEQFPDYGEQYRRWVFDELARRGIPIPDDREIFGRRLLSFAAGWPRRLGAFERPGDVKPLLEAAGFAVQRLEPIAVRIEAPYQRYLTTLGKQRFLAVAERLLG